MRWRYVTEGSEDSLSDWSEPVAAGRSDVAVCTSTWKIVDVLSGDESTYAACQSASVRPQPDRTYYSTSNRVAVYFIGQMTSSGSGQSTTAASTADDDHHHQQQQQPRHSDRVEDAPLQLLHYTGQFVTLLLPRPSRVPFLSPFPSLFLSLSLDSKWPSNPVKGDMQRFFRLLK